MNFAKCSRATLLYSSSHSNSTRYTFQKKVYIPNVVKESDTSENASFPG